LLLAADAVVTAQTMELVGPADSQIGRRKLRVASDVPVRIRKTFDLPDDEPADLDALAKKIARAFLVFQREAMR
jgi:hypothetical protein